MYWLQIIDYYCAFMTLMMICIVECLLVGYIYGMTPARYVVIVAAEIDPCD